MNEKAKDYWSRPERLEKMFTHNKKNQERDSWEKREIRQTLEQG